MSKRPKHRQGNDTRAEARDRDLAAAALERLNHAQTEDGSLTLVAPDGERIDLPACVVALLKDCLQCIARGDTAKVVAVRAELSTFEAAALLGVSRPFLIMELEAGRLPFRLVGSHRRIALAALLRYKSAIDGRRHEALDELTREAQELGMGY
ncbi:MAG: excisionase family DNA-binding protein [Phycisphaeraceae bacterium]|nr:excisionase family DNA-binding protein [Phycisphaeraceae bacterium]